MTMPSTFHLSGAVLLCLGFSQAALAAEDSTPLECSLTGTLLGNDIDFNQAARELAPKAGSITVSCKAVSQSEMKAGDVHLKFRVSDLYRGGLQGELMSASLVQIERLVNGKSLPVGWAVLPHDVLQGRAIEPQIAERDGVTLIRLASRHRHIYRLEDNSLQRIDAFEWRKDLNVDPAYRMDGQALSINLDTMEGRIAIVRTTGDTTPGQSAYEPTRITVASLSLKAKDLTIIDQKLVATPSDEDAFGLIAADRGSRSKLKNLPADTEACDLTAWSIDTDPKGLNVRSAASISAPVLGTVPGAIALSEADRNNLGISELRAEVRIVGYKNGWFLIEPMSTPLTPSSSKLAARLKPSVKGRGWISANMVSANQGTSVFPGGRLYRAPTTYAIFGKDKGDEHTSSAPQSLKHVHACSGGWALVETATGGRGWTRGICSNQASACR